MGRTKVSFKLAGKMSKYETEVAAAPEYYTAVILQERGIRQRAEAATLDKILEEAAGLYKDRPVAIYAVRGGMTAMLGTWVP